MKINVPLSQGYRGKGSRFPGRDQEIIRMLNLGNTLQKVGDKYGITRERVRQIYFKFVGKSNSLSKRENRRIAMEAEQKKTAFVCQICGKDITYKERKGAQRFCKECFPGVRRFNHEPRVGFTVICSGCGIKFSPTRSQYGRTQLYKDSKYTGRMFHNIDCFHKFMVGRKRGGTLQNKK